MTLKYWSITSGNEAIMKRKIFEQEQIAREKKGNVREIVTFSSSTVHTRRLEKKVAGALNDI
jgi:hypothetical protein